MRNLLLVDPAGRVVLSDVDSGARYAFEDVPTGDRPLTAPPARTAVWSAAGSWTAWSVGSADLDGFNEIRVHHEGAADNQVLVEAVTAFYLCPSPCGRFLSHLSPGPLGLELGVTDVRTGELHIIERGQPLFWSWSPDASAIAVHAGDRLSVARLGVDGADRAPRTLSDRCDSFVAPWWDANGAVVFAANGDICYARTESHTGASDEPVGGTVALAANTGAGRFALDPGGRRLAFIDLVAERPALVVIDLLTETRSVIAEERIAAFFWSPEGRRLAALVAAGSGRLQWLVWSGEDVVRLAPLRPSTAWLREVLPFFEQYAQSHTVWSADGSELVAAAIDEDGSSAAVVQRVEQSSTSEHVPGARLAWWADA